MWCTSRKRAWAYSVLIYVKDLTNAPPSSKITLFAHDMNMFLFGKDLYKLCAECNKVLENVCDWLLANKLSINVEKTDYTIFTPSRRLLEDTIVHLFINDIEISKSNFVKYLGVFIDKDLKWSEHIQYVYNNINKFLTNFDNI